MRKHIFRFAPAFLFVAALAACDGPTGPGETADPGSLGFSYAGAVSGTFGVEGAPRLDARGRPSFGAWAVAGPSVRFPEEKLTVVGLRGENERDAVLFAVSVPRLSAPGTVAIDRNCAGPECASALLLFGSDDPRTPHAGVERTCEILSGTLTVTSISEGRVTGTFSGRGHCVADVQRDPFLPFTISDGSFDAAITRTFRSGVNVI